MWSRCLGLAWLGLQVFETFSRARSFHCYHFYFFWVEGSVEKVAEFNG
ncbi:BgtTE-56037 [Blumeria graminis f. sp. tritici]|uniref:BgtTE-56037 n=1 Tax=Blumeria graminis f. sp. tritici TaxID=62690 RepID=A0A9X9MF93_BLUGR|nr:BgtTE-56037 [Blumeria graminis f. sp. tritici]